jgi:hypothetical protein
MLHHVSEAATLIKTINRTYHIHFCNFYLNAKTKLNSVTSVRERPSLVGEVSANFCG